LHGIQAKISPALAPHNARATIASDIAARQSSAILTKRRCGRPIRFVLGAAAANLPAGTMEMAAQPAISAAILCKL
jgi:hypothetical protein